MGRPSKDQREEIKYIGIVFIIIGSVSLLLNLARGNIDLLVIGFPLLFILIGFILLKYRDKLEDFRKSKRDEYLEKHK